MTIAILSDFDGTVTTTDASYEVLREFAGSGWEPVEREALEGRITILEALERQAVMVKASREEAERFLVSRMELREGFREFAEFCKERGIYLELCSDGFGTTMEVLLAKWGLDWFPWTSNRTEPSTEGWKIAFPHRRDGCPVNGNCKCSHLERLQGMHSGVIYVGDGTTDLCVARKADMVCARDRLHEIMLAEGRPHIDWKDWHVVKKAVMRLL